MVEPLHPAEPIEMTRDVVDRLFSQLDALAARVDHVIETQTQQERHLDRQDGTAAEAERQRAVMWKRQDEMATSQDRLLDVAEKVDERLSVVEGTVKSIVAEYAPGWRWATTFRKGLLWLGVITLGGAITALAGTTVAWLVNHGAAAFSWFKRGTE